MTKVAGEFKLTEEQCLEIGGHCWNQSDIVIDTYPSTYHRYCVHCGKSQHGQAQGSMKWVDVK